MRTTHTVLTLFLYLSILFFNPGLRAQNHEHEHILKPAIQCELLSFDNHDSSAEVRIKISAQKHAFLLFDDETYFEDIQGPQGNFYSMHFNKKCISTMLSIDVYIYNDEGLRMDQCFIKHKRTKKSKNQVRERYLWSSPY